MKAKLMMVTLLAAIVLAACGGKGTDEGKPVKEKETSNVKELVRDYSTGSKKAKNASITPQQLIVTAKDGSQTAYNLPKDEFFVSIAPYINETHPCTNHSLTGCKAELANKEFKLYIKDEDGNVLRDEMVTAQSNGFIDLWLPRNKTYQMKIELDGKKVESGLSTFNDDPTCITTMQLM